MPNTNVAEIKRGNVRARKPLTTGRDRDISDPSGRDKSRSKQLSHSGENTCIRADTPAGI